MAVLRNPEVLQSLLLHLCCSVAAVILTWCWEVRFGIFTLLLCLLFLGLHLIATIRRYRRLAALTGDIDRILHGEDTLTLDCYAEGELAILQSEVQKMTIRLREQQQALLEDKQYLADSLADISHQLRTPLTSIHLLTARLSDSALSAEQRLTLLRDQRLLLNRLDWLITALLKLSKLDAGTVQFHAEALSLTALLQKAVDPLLVPLELRGITLHRNASGSACVDVAWTAEAISNILKNCMEHTPQGGTITIDAMENPLFTEIRVQDTGSGIAPEDLPHIFERFYRGNHADENSYGIGLSLARRIITEQNGTIKAENAVTGGAVFTIRFYKSTI